MKCGIYVVGFYSTVRKIKSWNVQLNEWIRKFYTEWGNQDLERQMSLSLSYVWILTLNLEIWIQNFESTQKWIRDHGVRWGERDLERGIERNKCCEEGKGGWMEETTEEQEGGEHRRRRAEMNNTKNIWKSHWVTLYKLLWKDIQ